MIDIRSLLNGGLDAFGKTSSERWKLLVQAVIELQKRTFNGGGSSSSSSIGSGSSSNGSDGASHVTEAYHAKKADKAAEATHAETADKALDIANNSIFYKRFLRRDEEDTAEQTIGFLKGLWINAKELFGIDKNGNAVFSSINAKSTLRVDGNAVTKSLSSYEGITVGPEEEYGINQEGDVNANNVNAEGDVSAKENVQGNNLIAGNSLTVGGKAKINDDISAGHDIDVAGEERIDRIQSHNYSGTALSDTGFIITADNGTGSSMAVFDYLTIRKKMIVNSLEIKETHFSAGDVAHTLAAAEIARTDYLYVDASGRETLLGYSQIKVPWLLRGAALLLGKESFASRRLLTHYKKVRMTLTNDDLSVCNRVRCYFLAKDGDREIENWFRVGDLVRCQTWNIVKTRRETFIPDLEDHAGNVYWWRKITDVSWNTGVQRYVAKDASGQPTENTTTDINSAYINEGGIPRIANNGTYGNPDIKHSPKTIDGNTYHWFDVTFGYDAERSGEANWCDMGSDLPAAGDKVVQFGNTTDPDRMNIFLIEVNGAGNPDAPDWKMYRGVHTFNLTNCWWGGESCRKTKWSVATGIEAYAPQFKWITEYGIARQVFVRDEVYWNKIPFERDDDWSKAISSYPDYSDDIVDANGHFVSRADGSPKNYVRKCRYYEQVSHNGSAWLCSVVESFYWRSADGRKLPAKTDGAEYVRNYTYDEPSAESNNWTEQVEKGDPGAFKSTVFCRSNSTPAAPSNDKKDGCNTFDNPVPPAVSGQPTWTDGMPDGTAILWMSTAWFYSDGTHQNWTTPRQQTDTETLDIEFSPNATQPLAPVGTAANKDTSSIKTKRHNQGGENMGWFDPNDTLTGWTWSDMKWRAERKIKNGVYYGSWVITRIKGENSVRIDLVNDNESMLYTSGGTLVSGNVLSTARLFDGATDVSTSATWTMTAVGCTMSSGNSRNIVVTGMTAATGYVNVQAVYTDKNGTVYKKTKQLTLKKLVDVDKYDLDITPNSIAYNATKDKPATSLLTIKVWKMTVDGNRALSNPPSGYGVYVNNVKQTESSTGTYYYTTDNSAVSSVQVKIAKDSNLDDVLDSETIPVNKAEDGAGGDTPMQAFKWNDSPTSAPALPTKGSYNNGWTATAPNRPTGTAEYHLWMTQAVKHTAANKSVSYDAWGAAVRISGDKGEPGVDSADREWIYIGSKTYSSPYSGTHPKNITKDKDGTQRTSEYIHSTDDFVPYGWQDTAIATDDTNNKFVYASWRDKAKGATTWGDFTDPILWSNWGVQGIDGDGVQYVYKLFDHELTDAERVSNIPAKPASQTQGEWIPSGWSDDPLAPTSAKPYCYCSVIKKIGGSWSDTFEKLGMWSKWAKDADVWTIDSDGYWCKNDVRYVTPDGNYVLAEGKNGTGVEMKGSVDVLFNSEATQGQTSLEGVSAKIGECYSVKSTRHLYFYDGTSQESGIPSGWVDVGEFKGEKGDNSYVHIAYARSVSFDGSTITAVTGFIVDSNGSDYEWMGLCADNNPLDPGASGRDAGSDLANARFYKWNYMKGKDGNGYERVYLLAKDGVTPTVNQNSYTVTSDKPNYGHTDRTKDEFWPQVANYNSSQMQTSYWTDDPQSNPSEAWPVLWWAERKFDGNTQTWGDFCPPTEHNRFTSELAITLTRDNLYTEASWNTYAAIGHTESFVKRSGDSDFTVCRVGDRFVVSGKSSDKGLYHTATYKCTSVSANNIAGICISHLHDGKGISNVARTFAISNVGTTESETTEPVHHGSWTANSPAVTEQYPYLWAKEVVTFSDNTTTTKYYCIGSRGDNGVDAKDFEWVYIRTKTSAAPTILNDDTYVDTNGKDYTADDHLPRVIDNPNVENNGSRYQCTDDPKGVDETWKYEWESKRTKGSVQSDNSRAWNYYMGVMKLHNNFAESAFIIDLSNDNDQFGTDSDSKVIEAQTRSTSVMLYDGATRQVLNESDGVSAVLKYIDDDTAVPTSVAEVSCARDTQDTTIGYVRVTFKKDVTFAKSGLYAYITAKCAKGEKNATFTVRKLMSGQAGISPTIYQLAPSQKTFSFGRNASNILTPNSRTVEINATKTTGNTTSSATTSDDGLTYKWGFDEETATSEHSGLTLGTSITVSNTDAASHYQVWVELSSGDKETLPIVKDGTDGLSVQSYIETQEAWSNQETTASADTMPSDCQEGDWKDSTPANTNSRTYLWRRSRKMTLKTDKSGYDAGQWSYTRLSGTNGTSIKTQGTVANTSKLLDRQVIPLVNGSDGQRTDVQDGWAYISEADRHLYQWSDELRSKSSTWVDWRSGWLDLGEFKGESGKTYYTHIAWAKGVILKKDGDGRAVTTDRTAGQRTMPNAVYPMTAAEQALFDFSIAPQEDLTWMGTLVDEDTNDAADYKYYTWKYVQGADGKSAVRIDLDNQADLVSVDADGKVRFARTVVVRARIFDGADMVTDDSKVSHSMTKASMKFGSREPSSIVKSNGVVTVQWDFSKGDSVTDQTKTFTLNYGGQGYSEEFTLGTTKSDVIYQLMPSPSEVSFSKGSDGKTLTPSHINLYGGYVKENGGAPVTVQQPNGSQIDSSNYLYYRVKGADGTWGAWTAYPASPNNFLQVASSTTNTDIEFCISTASVAGSVSDSNIVDRENVPIVKDGINGDKGDNSIRLALDNDHEDFLYNASGELVAPAGGATSQARLYDGALPISANSVTWAVDFSKSSGVPTAGQNAPTCVNGLLTVPHVTGASAKVAVKATYNSKDYFAEFTANKTEGDKYDIVVKPNAIPYNSSEAFTEKTINLSVKGIDAQGHNIDSISIDTSETPSAGKFCVFWGYVNANGSVGTLSNLKASSKKVTAVECNTYAGIYFELRRYSDGSTYRLCDYETVEIAKVQNGDSNLIVDLDNQADQFGTDSNDVVQGDAVRSTEVSLYYGSEQQEFLASGGLTAQLYYASDNDELHPITNGNIATVGVSYSGGTGTVTVTVKDGATIADSGLFAKIVAKCAKDTTGKVAYFNLGKVKSGEPGKAPDICNLRPTSKSISFNKSELAGSTPKKLGCGYTLIKDSVTTNAETAESVVVNGVTYYIYWRYAGGTYARFTTSSAIWATGILPATSEKGVEFCLSSATTAEDITIANTLDTENVPIVKDGVNGSATFHEIQSSQASVIVGAESTQAVINVNFIFRLNTSGVYSAYSCYYAVYRRKGGAYTLKESSHAKATTGSYSETVSNYTTVDAWVVVMSDSVITSADSLPSSFLAKLEIPVEKQGARGDDGYTISVNPVGVTIIQDGSGNFNVSSSVPAYVDVKITKGNDTATNLVSAVAIASNQCAADTTKPIVVATVPNNTIRLKVTGVGRDAAESKYTKGSVVLTVTADSKTFSVTVPVAVNYLGTYIQTIFTDRKEEMAHETKTLIDKEGNYVVNDSTYKSVVNAAQTSMEWINTVNTPAATVANYNTRLSTAEQNSARIERDTTELVKNIDNTAFEDIDGTQVELSAGEYIVQLKVDTEDLPTGNYVFDFAGFHYEGGEQFIEQRITVENSGTYTITLHNDVQSGVGVVNMLYIGRVFNVSSEIKQMAGNIMLKVNGKVSQSDFNIFSNSIQSSVKNISPSKNLLKGSLSAKGWLSSPSDVVASGVPYTSAKSDDDGYIVTNGNDQYLAQKLTLSGGKTYALSFYSKKTTAITVTVWVVDYPTMKQTFTVAATGASDRKTAKIEVSPYLGGYMGISINATNIKHPQLEEGDTATDFIADSTEISSDIIQIADNIQLFVTKGLSNTGIDITNGTIMLQANKVTFCDANGGNTDKIRIDPTNGTLHAVDGHFSGEITATSGSIGGFGITGSQISSLNNNIILKSDGSATLGGFKVATNGTASLTSTLTVGNANSQRIEIIPFDKNKLGSGTINFINADSDKILKIGFYNDYYGSIDLYSPATKQNPEECAVSVRSNYLQISSENTDNAKESYITMLTSTNNAYSQYTFDDKVNKMFLTSGVEGGTLMLRAYKPNGSSAWPVCSLDPNGANWMDKGHVHVMTMGELKVLLNNPNSIYSSHLANYAVMLTRINGN